MMDIRKVIDNPARYMKYLKGEYKSRYKDSIFLKEVGSRVMYIDIDIYQLAEHDITISDFRSLLVKQFNPVTKHIECPICHKNLNSGHITLAIDHNLLLLLHIEHSENSLYKLALICFAILFL